MHKHAARRKRFTGHGTARRHGACSPTTDSFLRRCERFCMHETATLDGTPGTAMPPTILIVDDEPEVRTVVAEFLEDFGYHVLQADGGAQALTRLHDEPTVRLLISDIRMPEMSGIELANLATQQKPLLKVILISGYFVSQQVNRRFLRKPFRMKELEAAVRAELDTGC
jgi:CheY-like chemotaxis protein